MFRTSNPTLRESTFENVTAEANAEPMTIEGTVKKTGILLVLLVLTALIGWRLPHMGAMIGCLIAGFVLAIVACFKKEWSPTIGPLYAVVEGYALGVFSLMVSAMVGEKYSSLGGAVPIAVLGTFSVLAAMLGLYATGIIKVNDTFRAVVIGATVAIGITYLGSWILSMFWPGVFGLPIYGSGWQGIAFSAFVIVIAALNLALDFQLISDGAESGAPKYMEWYGAFALTVTLVWLYIEILRLLLKLSRR